LACLYLVENSIVTYFFWQGIASLSHALVISIALWRCLPHSEKRARFDLHHLKRVSPFAIKTGILSILSLLLIHGDKLVISKMASLEEYGYYTLAANLAMSLYFIITPLFTAFFPRYCQFAAQRDKIALRNLYYKSCQMLSFLLMPIAAVLVFFSKEILILWTHNAEFTEKCFQVLSILSLGSLFNGLMNMPYALQMSYGWMSLVLWQNSLSVLLLLPATVVCFQYYGIIGAAWTWLVHNALCVLICLPIIHRKLLQEGVGHWLKKCFIIPATIAMLVTFLAYSMRGEMQNRLQIICLILFTLIASYALTTVIMPFSRTILKKYWPRRKDYHV
jgi:O-antigen/teichoic acid export membrane protein